MRIALISAIDHIGRGDNVALMPLAGRSLAHRQLDLALALGCERIVCLTERPEGEILLMQHAAERAGAKFNAITGSRALAGLVTAADELLVVASGILTDARLVRDALGDRPGILTLPAERAVAAGFERIDAETAWSGVLIAPGRAAERLADLPADSDPVSGLLRISLQFGVRRVVLAPASLDAGDLMLVGGGEDLAKAERRWLQASARSESWYMPGAALAAGLARVTAPAMLARRRAPLIAGVAGAALSAAGAALVWFERPAAGLLALTLSAVAFVAGRTWRGIERGAIVAPGTGTERIGHFLLDAVLLAAVLVVAPRFPAFAAFSAAVLVLAVRLAFAKGARSYAAPAGDRIVVLAILSLAAALDKLLPAVQALALAALLLNLLAQSRVAANAGLTTPR